MLHLYCDTVRTIGTLIEMRKRHFDVYVLNEM